MPPNFDKSGSRTLESVYGLFSGVDETRLRRMARNNAENDVCNSYAYTCKLLLSL